MSAWLEAGGPWLLGMRTKTGWQVIDESWPAAVARENGRDSPTEPCKPDVRVVDATDVPDETDGATIGAMLGEVQRLLHPRVALMPRRAGKYALSWPGYQDPISGASAGEVLAEAYSRAVGAIPL